MIGDQDRACESEACCVYASPFSCALAKTRSELTRAIAGRRISHVTPGSPSRLLLKDQPGFHKTSDMLHAAGPSRFARLCVLLLLLLGSSAELAHGLGHARAGDSGSDTTCVLCATLQATALPVEMVAPHAPAFSVLQDRCGPPRVTMPRCLPPTSLRSRAPPV
jgi:hypothetical protein